MSALDTQEGGGHYKDCKIQPIEFTVANGLGFIEGNIIKYITRHKDKNGAEDIKKIIHYCELLLELEYGEKSDKDHEFKEATKDYIKMWQDIMAQEYDVNKIKVHWKYGYPYDESGNLISFDNVIVGQND